jgi:hypothetical protein
LNRWDRRDSEYEKAETCCGEGDAGGLKGRY